MKRFMLARLVGVGLVGASLFGTQPAWAANQSYDLFGTMLAFQSSTGFAGRIELEALLLESWLSLRQDEQFEDFLSTLEATMDGNAELVADTHFSSNRDIVGAFTWNVVVPQKGEYDWTVTDATLEAAGQAEVTLSAVIQPYSSWGSSQELDTDICNAIDFAYFDYATGLPEDWKAYKNFLRKTVERYDGDGVDDMPGLTTRVESWEIGNEIEGPCGGDLGKAKNYIQLLKKSYSVIKEADPDAVVTNAGALEIIGNDGNEIDDTIAFWQKFFHQGGDEYLDVFNMHYNTERDGAHDSQAEWIAHLQFFTDLLESRDVPIWLTEFGTYSGVNSSSGLEQTQDFQAAWYLRYVVRGMYYGVDRFYMDLSGAEGNPVTGGAFFDEYKNPRKFLTTLKKLAKITDGYTAVKKIRSGQYKIMVPDQPVYVLWAGPLPDKLQTDESFSVYNWTGEKQVLSGNEITYSVDQPVMVQ